MRSSLNPSTRLPHGGADQPLLDGQGDSAESPVEGRPWTTATCKPMSGAIAVGYLAACDTGSARLSIIAITYLLAMGGLE